MFCRPAFAGNPALGSTQVPRDPDNAFMQVITLLPATVIADNNLEWDNYGLWLAVASERMGRLRNENHALRGQDYQPLSSTDALLLHDAHCRHA